MEKKPIKEWKPIVELYLDSKVQEFIQIGLSKTTKEEVWKCLEEKVWKKDDQKRLHEVVQDIMHLNSSDYMSYLTIGAHENEDLMTSIRALTKE